MAQHDTADRAHGKAHGEQAIGADERGDAILGGKKHAGENRRQQPVDAEIVPFEEIAADAGPQRLRGELPARAGLIGDRLDVLTRGAPLVNASRQGLRHFARSELHWGDLILTLVRVAEPEPRAVGTTIR